MSNNAGIKNALQTEFTAPFSPDAATSADHITDAIDQRIEVGTNATQALTGNMAAITWQVQVIKDSAYSFTAPSTTITVLEAGRYEIKYKLNVENTGAGAGGSYAEIQKNGGAISYDESFAYHGAVGAEERGTLISWVTLTLAANDTITIRAKRYIGGALCTLRTRAGCLFTIRRL